MLLRIIDKSTHSNVSDSVDIIFTYNDKSIEFSSEYFPSHFSHNFQKTLEWYFNSYLHELPPPENDKEVITKLIALGKYMGDELLGEDHELSQVTQIIQGQGFSQLSVSIESSRFEFFDEQWEAAILPESPYILSTVSNSFTRCFNNSADSVANTNDIDAKNLALSLDNPLNILHIVAQSSTGNMLSCALQTNQALLSFDGVINHQIWPLSDWSSLKHRLQNKQQPIHIIQYDGPIEITGHEPTIPMLSKDAGISFGQINKALDSNDFSLLMINATAYFQQEQSISAETGLAWVAHTAQQHSIDNVIGMSQYSDPWISNECITTVYEYIGKGFSIAQAIVEVRKQLQSKTESDLFREKAVPFQSWPLLRHYGNKSTISESPKTVTFFNEALTRNQLLDSQYYNDLRQRLHGFRSEFFPPYLPACSDGQFPAALNQCNGKNVVSIGGQAGSGKTHLCHSLVFYLLQHQYKFAFYFNFDDYQYSESDILNMIAPVLETKDTKEVITKLDSSQCVFVFDNLNFIDDEKSNAPDEQLLNFINTQSLQKHLFIITSQYQTETIQEKLNHCSVTINTNPLLQLEQQLITARQFRHYEIKDKDNNTLFPELLASFNGHPYLTHNVPPALYNNTIEDLLNKSKQYFGDSNRNNYTDQFCHWQWAELDDIWKSWLLLLIDVPGVLLEMLTLGSDFRENFQPAADLFELLGDTEAKLSDGIKSLTRANFAQSFPHGHMINNRHINFLKQQRDEHQLLQRHAEKLTLLFTQVVCESFNQLIDRTQQQPNAAINQNLLANRGLWGEQLKTLWQQHSYSGFTHTFSHLKKLLQQNKLDNELPPWSLELLTKHFTIPQINTQQINDMVAWLNISTNALAAPNAIDEAVFTGTANHWLTWLKQLHIDDVEQNSALFYHCLQYLTVYYPMKNDWQTLKEVSQTAYNHYRHYGVWERALPQLHTLTHCHFQLDETEQGLIREQELLTQVPYDKFPPGTQTQTSLQIISARIARSDNDGAQELVDQLRDHKEASSLTTVIDSFQADIYYNKNRYQDAVLIYCKLYLAAYTNQTPALDFLNQKLIELKNKIPTDEFEKIFAENVGADIPQPGEIRPENSQIH